MALLPSLSPARIAELTAGIVGTGPELRSCAPFTGELLATVPSATAADVSAAAATARRAQHDWARVAPKDRAAVLLRLHDLVLAHTEQLLDVVQAETGKARGHAFEEVADVANSCRYYGRTAPRLLAPRRRIGALPVLTRAVEYRWPVGLVGLITPWNYPLTLGVADALPALAAGNAVLHKPDTQTLLTALAGRELAIRAGLPADLWQIVAGDGPVVGPLLIDTVDHVSFTGSTSTGRAVAGQTGQRLIGASLELGGKNAMIIAADADLSRAVPGAVAACFSSAGQLCISIERIYAHRAIADEFTTRFVAAVRALRIGAGYDRRFDLGSLTSAAQLDRVRADVDDAVAHGAQVLTGGRPRPDLGPYFYEPTVLADVPEQARCHAEETFGPVVAIYPVDSDDEAVAAANDSRYGLNASVWSSDASRAQRIAERLQAGTVNVNDGYAAAWGSVDAPMGGYGDSGLGRRHGADGLLSTTWSQTIATQKVASIGESRWLHGRVHQRVFTATLRTFKALRRP